MSPLTDNQLEDLLRSTFASKEPLAPPHAPRLARQVLRRRDGRRRVVRRAVLAATAVAAVATLAVPVLRGVGRLSSEDSAGSTYGGAQAASPAPGWRWESSLGVQIQVPRIWAVNDYGCDQDDRPSVVRGAWPAEPCKPRELPTKELAIIAASAVRPASPAAPPAKVRYWILQGVPAQRADGRLADGRFAAWVWLPSLQVAVMARTLSAATTKRIADSVRLAAPTDNNGCPAQAPPAGPPRAGSAGFDPVAVSVCGYRLARDGTAQPVVWFSYLAGGDLVRLLAADLGRGRRVAGCAGPDPGGSALAVGMRHADGTLAWLRVRGCPAGAGEADDGATMVQLGPRTMAALHR
jgi:hypothetical protein